MRRNYWRVMQEASLLGNMVRLADIMMVEGVVAWGVSSAEQLLNVLESSKVTSESKQSRVRSNSP